MEKSLIKLKSLSGVQKYIVTDKKKGEIYFQLMLEYIGNHLELGEIILHLIQYYCAFIFFSLT